eukprot:5420728-Pyramimonas_sp.AAC.1
MRPEGLPFDSEHSEAWEELYEVPGGDQVDGSPPVPVRDSDQAADRLQSSGFNRRTRPMILNRFL